ncbi:MAG: hypothetical protein P8X96_07925 [Desulfobacteraceae bacterium]
MRKKEVVFTIVVFVSILILTGCSCLNYRPTPVKNAAIGINIEPGGKIVFVGQDGEIRKPVPFSPLLTKLLKDDPEQKGDYKKRIEKVQTINVWLVKGSFYLMYEVNGEAICDQYSDQGVYEGPCH